MKRMVCVLAVVLLSVILSGANAESFISSFSHSIGGIDAAYDLGNTLLIICEYDKLINAGTADISNQTEKFKDNLLKYERILILCVKDDMIYLAIEMPLVDGVFIENTGNALMSKQYLTENMRIGN